MPTKNKKKIPAKSKKIALDEKGKPNDRLMAGAAVSPLVSNAMILATYAEPQLGDISLSDLIQALHAITKTIKTGDMSEVEDTLITQAITLNTIFSELTRRAALNIGVDMDAMETYMKLALRTQNQCRATLETLSDVKHPPVVFAKQANIAQGHQQVNNGSTPAALRAGESENPPNKLLEAGHEQRMVDGTTCTPSSSNPRVEAVGAINRAKDKRRQVKSKP